MGRFAPLLRVRFHFRIFRIMWQQTSISLLLCFQPLWNTFLFQMCYRISILIIIIILTITVKISKERIRYDFFNSEGNSCQIAPRSQKRHNITSIVVIGVWYINILNKACTHAIHRNSHIQKLLISKCICCKCMTGFFVLLSVFSLSWARSLVPYCSDTPSTWGTRILVEQEGLILITQVSCLQSSCGGWQESTQTSHKLWQ